MTELSKEAIEHVADVVTDCLMDVVRCCDGRIIQTGPFRQTVIALLDAHARRERENAELRAERERLMAVATTGEAFRRASDRVCGDDSFAAMDNFVICQNAHNAALDAWKESQ